MERFFKFFFTITVAILAFAQVSNAAISNIRYRNQLYVNETEGLTHAFSATLYKAVDNGNYQVKFESSVVNDISPVYSSRKSVGTSFATPEAAKAAAEKVFGDTQIQQMISNVFGYATTNHVGIVHISFLYSCKINGKKKGVLLYYDVNLNNSQKVSDFLMNPPKTSGYLIVDSNPVWVKISYTSRNLDSSVQHLATYSKIRASMQKKGILGRLIIQEMNLDGTVAKTLVNTQINDNRFEMPVSGTYVPEVYITKIINAYKTTIQKDSPIFLLVDYLGSPTIALNSNGTPKINMKVIQKEILATQSGNVGGWSCVGVNDATCGKYYASICGVGSVFMEKQLISDKECLVINKRGDVFTYREFRQGRKITIRNTSYNIHDGVTSNTSKSYCVANGPFQKGYTSTVHPNVFHGGFRHITGNTYFKFKEDEPLFFLDVMIGGKYVQARQGPWTGWDRKLNIFTQSGYTGWGYNWTKFKCNIDAIQVDHGRIRLCYGYRTDLIVNGKEYPLGEYWIVNKGYKQCLMKQVRTDKGLYFETIACFRNARVRRVTVPNCGDWINLIPHYHYNAYRTVYHVSYGIGGLLTRYLVSEPLNRINISSTQYYYAMDKILQAKINYNNTALGVASGYNITKTAGGAYWNKLKSYIQGKSKAQLDRTFHYLVVDPFKTHNIINVRHDTVNGLTPAQYPNYGIPVTVVVTNE